MILGASKHMFANIQRKQRLIDEQFRRERDTGKGKSKKKQASDEERLFTSKFIESVLLRHGNTSNIMSETKR